MEIIAIDPGLTIGVAYYNTKTQRYYGDQFQYAVDVCEWIENLEQIGVDLDIAVIENYQSAGNLTKEARETIRLIGYFEAYFRYFWDIQDIRVVAPQHRLSGKSQAQNIAPQFAEYSRRGRDAYAALSHAIVVGRDYA